MSILESSNKVLAILALVVVLAIGGWSWHVHQQHVADARRTACERQNSTNDLAAAYAGYQYGAAVHHDCG